MADPFFLKTYQEERQWASEEGLKTPQANPVVPPKALRHTYKSATGTRVTQHGSLLSWNAKTRSISFDLPALMTCPGAKSSLEQTGAKPGLIGICSLCYASKGAYVWPTNKSVTRMRYEFSKGPDFVDTMIHALKTRKRKYLSHHYDPDLDNPGFFRVHSSGDIYSAEYAEKWHTICSAFPDTLFWFPTRIWAAPFAWQAGAEHSIAKLTYLENVILRPSMLTFNQFPQLDFRDKEMHPMRYSAPTGALIFRDLNVPARIGGKRTRIVAKAESELEEHWKQFAWFCPATPRDHLKAKGHNIANTWNCDVQKCRKCWTEPDRPIVYRVH